MPHGGYGLGNDLIPWAKGYILAQELGGTVLHPAWGNNPRQYHLYFGTSKYDHHWYRVLRRLLPRYRFTEDRYREIGQNNFAESCRIFAKDNDLHNKANFIVEITGFWGAFAGLEVARDYLISQLAMTLGTQSNLFQVKSRLKSTRLTIGVHVRLGDFRAADSDGYAGAEQVSVPLEWYIHLCDALDSAFGQEHVQFILCSDGRPDQLKGLTDRRNIVFASAYPRSDISDLLLLKDADLMICSISSFSMWAAFLSSSPYLWYRPNLVKGDDGLHSRFIRSLGIYDLSDNRTSGVGRTTAIAVGEPLPSRLIDYLALVLSNRDLRGDLVRGGSLKIDAGSATVSGMRLF